MRNDEPVITPFRPLARPLLYPLQDGARPPEVLQQLGAAELALVASRECLVRIADRLSDAVAAVPVDADRGDVADLWYDAHIRPLLGRGVFSDAWLDPLVTYAESFAAAAVVLPEWEPVAVRANAILEAHSELEAYRDGLMSTLLSV